MRHYHRCGQRHGEGGEQGLAERGKISVGEGSLEFTYAHGKLVAYLHVGPCLLQEIASGSGGVD